MLTLVFHARSDSGLWLEPLTRTSSDISVLRTQAVKWAKMHKFSSWRIIDGTKVIETN